MNTIDWFVFIQQEHYFAPKCFDDDMIFDGDFPN